VFPFPFHDLLTVAKWMPKEEQCYGKEKMPRYCNDGTDADSPVYPLCWLWSTDVGRLPHATKHYHFAGDLSSDTLCPSVPQSTL
jgi:hypothetical protein